MGVPTCRQWNSRRDIISTPFQMIKTLIAQIEDQQSLAMNRALNIMPWMVELMFFQRLVMSIQLGLWLGNPRRTFFTVSMPGQWNITSSWLVRLASQGSRQGRGKTIAKHDKRFTVDLCDLQKISVLRTKSS